MSNAIEITKDFPPSRERAVLLELLAVTQALKKEGIDAVVCGGWVPFLKELARDCQTSHSTSFDIDVILRAQAREREAVDRIKALLSKSFVYQPDKDKSFRYQKTIDGNPIQLDLLADVARIKEDEAILKIHGLSTSLDLCCVDGGEDLNDHIETLTINVRDDVETFETTVPNRCRVGNKYCSLIEWGKPNNAICILKHDLHTNVLMLLEPGKPMAIPMKESIYSADPNATVPVG